MKNKPLTALLLSAGFGSRLRPITYNIPKCLIEINNKPILEHWLAKLEGIGCERVLINTHYLFEDVNKFIQSRKKSSMLIEIKYEKELLGTAGTLINNYSFFKDSTIIMIHVDNMTNFDIKNILDFHIYKKKDTSLLTMLTFKTDNPSSCGVVVTDKHKILREFHEKVNKPPTNIANGAFYIFDYCFLKKLKEEMPSAKDFSKDVIPNYLGKITTYFTEKAFIDIGTLENLSLARKIFE